MVRTWVALNIYLLTDWLILGVVEGAHSTGSLEAWVGALAPTLACWMVLTSLALSFLICKTRGIDQTFCFFFFFSTLLWNLGPSQALLPRSWATRVIQGLDTFHSLILGFCLVGFSMILWPYLPTTISNDLYISMPLPLQSLGTETHFEGKEALWRALLR